jgi:hypothetical protein
MKDAPSLLGILPFSAGRAAMLIIDTAASSRAPALRKQDAALKSQKVDGKCVNPPATAPYDRLCWALLGIVGQLARL